MCTPNLAEEEEAPLSILGGGGVIASLSILGGQPHPIMYFKGRGPADHRSCSLVRLGLEGWPGQWPAQRWEGWRGGDSHRLAGE